MCFANTLRVGKKLLSLESPKVMGVINSTPDSFYSASSIRSASDCLRKAEALLIEGADILDIGGVSSRPGAQEVSEKEELRRTVSYIRTLHKTFPEAILSIDTYRVTVAEAALEEGAVLVNDISGGTLDPNMLPFITKHNIPYILMHMRATPQTMQQHTHYKDLLGEVFAFLEERLSRLRAEGVSDIIVDVGLGFAKTVDQNFQLLRHLSFFKSLEAPLLVGVSRKSMIHKTLNCTPEDALLGTAALHMQALLQGASILRVHDAGAARQVIQLYNKLSFRET